MRACKPDAGGYAERNGVKVYYEVFGTGTPTILLLPAWSVVHSRTWKMQLPYLARHYRVVGFDGRGNGRSDRPVGARSYLAAEYAADALAVMDATGTERAVVVSLSRGASYSLRLAATCPERVAAQVFISPTTPLAPFPAARMELVASNRPFLYFPLGHHCEQTFHVPHRLGRYRAGRRMDYLTSTPETIAAAIAEEIAKPVSYRAIDPGAVGRVAARLGEML